MQIEVGLALRDAVGRCLIHIGLSGELPAGAQGSRRDQIELRWSRSFRSSQSVQMIQIWRTGQIFVVHEIGGFQALQSQESDGRSWRCGRSWPLRGPVEACSEKLHCLG